MPLNWVPRRTACGGCTAQGPGGFCSSPSSPRPAPPWCGREQGEPLSRARRNLKKICTVLYFCSTKQRDTVILYVAWIMSLQQIPTVLYHSLFTKRILTWKGQLSFWGGDAVTLHYGPVLYCGLQFWSMGATATTGISSICIKLTLQDKLYSTTEKCKQCVSPTPGNLCRLSPGDTSCVEYATPMIDLYNDSLESLLGSLRASLIGSTIILSRADRIMDSILADPGAYGMSSNRSACCEGGSFTAYSSDIGGCGMPGYTLCPPVSPRAGPSLPVTLLYCFVTVEKNSTVQNGL